MKNRGFTLTEVLIAAAIFSLIGLTLYSAFQTGFTSYNRINNSLDAYQKARIVLSRMELDLKNAFAYSKDDSRFQGVENGLDFLSVADSFRDGKPFVNICNVRYELSGGKLNRGILTGIDALIKGVDRQITLALDNVAGLQLEYVYATKDPNAPYASAGIWPGNDDQKPSLPAAVKIKLSLLEKAVKSKEKAGMVEFNKTVYLAR